MTEPGLTIRGLKARAVDAPMVRPIKSASGSVPSAPLLLLDLETEEGVTGHAYVFGYTPLTLKPMATLAEQLGESLAGKLVAPVERMAEMESRFRLLGRQGLLGMVISGIDMALWDALARSRDEPLAVTLGGIVKPIPAYDSYGVVDLARDRGEIEETLAQGFRAIKIKLGDGNLEKDVATTSALREMVGPEIRVMVDYNQSLSVPEAIRRVGWLSAYDISWVEEPVPAEDLKGHAAVRAGVSVPVQTGENWWFLADMAKAVEAGACDLAMPDVMKIGGVTGWLKAAALGEAASMPVSSHLFVEISAHLMTVTPTAHYLEFLDIARALLRSPAEIKDGTLEAKGPGIGLDWDEEALRRYLV